MSLEVTSEVSKKGKSSYRQILADVADTSSQSSRSGVEARESRQDINRTSESTQTGGKESTSANESKSKREINTQTATDRASLERVNLGFSLKFSIPLTGIIPTSPGGNC